MTAYSSYPSLRSVACASFASFRKSAESRASAATFPQNTDAHPMASRHGACAAGKGGAGVKDRLTISPCKPGAHSIGSMS